MTALRILAIDSAKRLGWAYGPIGHRPISGSIDCAKAGASRGAVFFGAGRWIVDFLSEHPADILAIEAPMTGQGAKTSARTAALLGGLPGVLEANAYAFRVYDQYRPYQNSIRSHFIGRGNLPSAQAKAEVFAKCVALGWIKRDDDDQSFDRSDALAIWSYAEREIAPKLAQPVDGLFLAAQARRGSA